MDHESAGTAEDKRPPHLRVPEGACDTHMHIYDPRYLTLPGVHLPAMRGQISEYRLLQSRLGLTRVVIVQPVAYGTDNSCTLDAMAKIGPRARGVAVLDPLAPDTEFVRLTRLGIRGLRYFMLAGGVLGWGTLARMAARCAEHGWHVQIQLEGPELAERELLLAALPCDVVIDHIGRFAAPIVMSRPGVQALFSLLETGRCWVKLSAPYHGSKSGPPDYEDVGGLARELVRTNPSRLLWATNWPHPSFAADFPEESDLIDLLGAWAPDPAVQQSILVDNPAKLYGFE